MLAKVLKKESQTSKAKC